MYFFLISLKQNINTNDLLSFKFCISIGDVTFLSVKFTTKAIINNTASSGKQDGLTSKLEGKKSVFYAKLSNFYFLCSCKTIYFKISSLICFRVRLIIKAVLFSRDYGIMLNFLFHYITSLKLCRQRATDLNCKCFLQDFSYVSGEYILQPVQNNPYNQHNVFRFQEAFYAVLYITVY